MLHGVMPFMMLSAKLGLMRLIILRSFTLPIFTSYSSRSNALMNSFTNCSGEIFPFPLLAVMAVSTIGGIISNTFILSSWYRSDLEKILMAAFVPQYTGAWALVTIGSAEEIFPMAGLSLSCRAG